MQQSQQPPKSFLGLQPQPALLQSPLGNRPWGEKLGQPAVWISSWSEARLAKPRRLGLCQGLGSMTQTVWGSSFLAAQAGWLALGLQPKLTKPGVLPWLLTWAALSPFYGSNNQSLWPKSQPEAERCERRLREPPPAQVWGICVLSEAPIPKELTSNRAPLKGQVKWKLDWWNSRGERPPRVEAACLWPPKRGHLGQKLKYLQDVGMSWNWVNKWHRLVSQNRGWWGPWTWGCRPLQQP